MLYVIEKSGQIQHNLVNSYSLGWTWHWQAVGVVVHVCHEGCGRLVVVVAVGESGEAAGPVGVDGGGGWNGTVVSCLLFVDDNKSSVGVCQRLLWV